jgi:hypothetical protein
LIGSWADQGEADSSQQGVSANTRQSQCQLSIAQPFKFFAKTHMGARFALNQANNLTQV